MTVDLVHVVLFGDAGADVEELLLAELAADRGGIAQGGYGRLPFSRRQPGCPGCPGLGERDRAGVPMPL
jgi:hypothetical protein